MKLLNEKIFTFEFPKGKELNVENVRQALID